MSLNSLARRHAAGTQAGRSLLATPTPAAGSTPSGGDAFETLARYLPAETMTLFIGALAAIATLGPEQKMPREILPWIAYGVFATLTPTIYLLTALAKQREAERQAGTPPQVFSPHAWPPIAALIAFVVWALSVQGLLAPGVMQTWGALIAFAAIFVSSLLSLVDRVLGLPSPE